VSTAEAQAFADRMGSLFVEASAKTSVGVREAFRTVVERIIDTPALWGAATKAGGARKAKARNEPVTASGGSMPGTIDLSGEGEEASAGGCGC
jgi:Ras-related protein Rab-18